MRDGRSLPNPHRELLLHIKAKYRHSTNLDQITTFLSFNFNQDKKNGLVYNWSFDIPIAGQFVAIEMRVEWRRKVLRYESSSKVAPTKR